MILLYESQDINGLCGKYYKRQYEAAQCLYRNKESNSAAVADAFLNNVNDNRPFIFFDYVMKFYGNGRIVELVKTDKYYINMSALMREDKDGNATEYYMFLHRPYPGAPLEVIR